MKNEKNLFLSNNPSYLNWKVREIAPKATALGSHRKNESDSNANLEWIKKDASDLSAVWVTQQIRFFFHDRFTEFSSSYTLVLQKLQPEKLTCYAQGSWQFSRTINQWNHHCKKLHITLLGGMFFVANRLDRERWLCT